MNRLLELRNERQLSQRSIAKTFNVSQGTYNNWENSNTQPSIEQLIQLAKFFSVTVDYLIGNSDELGNVQLKYSLSNEEQQLLKLYSETNDATKKAVMLILENSLKK